MYKIINFLLKRSIILGIVILVAFLLLPAALIVLLVVNVVKIILSLVEFIRIHTKSITDILFKR